MKTQLLLLTLFAVIINQTNCANEVQQHDFINEDIRNMVAHLLHDVDMNTHLLLQQNLTVKGIHFKDDALVKFGNIKFNKVPRINPVNTSLGIQCIINDFLKISIPLGYHTAEGWFEQRSNGEIYFFAISLKAYAGIEMRLNSSHTNDEKFEIKIESFGVEIIPNSSNKHNDMINMTFDNQLPSIKSQILEQLFAQIKKQDLLSYFATVKNYCFPSKIDLSKLYYLINQTHELTYPSYSGLRPSYNFVINWIKLKNIRFALSFSKNITFPLSFHGDVHLEETKFVLQASQPIEVMFSGCETDLNKYSEYNMQLNDFKMDIVVLKKANQATPRIDIVHASNIEPHNLTGLQQYVKQIHKIIREDWMSFLRQKCFET